MLGQLDLFSEITIDRSTRLITLPFTWLTYKGPMDRAMGSLATKWRSPDHLEDHRLKPPVHFNGIPFGVSGGMLCGVNPGYSQMYVHEYTLGHHGPAVTRTDRAQYHGPDRDLGIQACLPNGTRVTIGLAFTVIANDYSSYSLPPESHTHRKNDSQPLVSYYPALDRMGDHA